MSPERTAELYGYGNNLELVSVDHNRPFPSDPFSVSKARWAIVRCPVGTRRWVTCFSHSLMY